MFDEAIKTHTAVIAILVYQGSVLMMMRNNTPYCWGPPAGRVHVGEPLEEALLREVKEETGLSCHIMGKVDEWAGLHDGEEIKSKTFVCAATSNHVTLSDEHSKFEWIPVAELLKWQDKTDIDLTDWPSHIEKTKNTKETTLF